ncbi:MAG: hypothetical protein ACR2H2_15315, partial [Solirubrobacteraceae bacterium]
MSLKDYRQHHGLTQEEVVAEVRKRALARGDSVVPGLNRVRLSWRDWGRSEARTTNSLEISRFCRPSAAVLSKGSGGIP